MRKPASATQAAFPLRARGFSLLEVLVAFVILALVATALFQLFSGSLRNASVSEEYSRATLYAESRLASIANEAPLREGSQQGVSEDGRYNWSATVAPYVRPASTPEFDSALATLPLRLWRIAVIVTWTGTTQAGRSIALATLKLVPKQP